MTKLGGIIMITKKSELSDVAIWAEQPSKAAGLLKKPACVVL